MKIRKIRPVIVSLLIGVTFASCASTHSGGKKSISQADNKYAAELFKEINTLRGERGAKNVQQHYELDQLALVHSKYLCENRATLDLENRYVLSIGQHGRAVVARKTLDMRDMREICTVLKSDSKSISGQTPSELIAAFGEDSPATRVIIDKTWTHAGTGIAIDDDGTVFVTQLFAVKNIFNDRAKILLN